MRIKIDRDLLNGSYTLLESQKNCRNSRAGKLHCAKFKVIAVTLRLQSYRDAS